MKFSHTVKFNLNRSYEMHEMVFEATEADFPETIGMDFSSKARYIQALIIQGLLFQVAVGYISPTSLNFTEAKRMALALMGTISKEVACPDE